MDINTEVHNAAEVIKNGGIILYPTDTVWGIGCDATNEEAVAKIYALKQRAEIQSMLCLMNGEKMIYNVFSNIPEVAWQIWDLSEKPTTLILDKPRNVAKKFNFVRQYVGCSVGKRAILFQIDGANETSAGFHICKYFW